MRTIQMLVSLKIPDATALSALQALHEMGFKRLKSLERSIHYEFQVSGDERKFQESIKKADILVNSNKHTATFSVQKNIKKIAVLVEDREQGSAMLSNLRERLGFSQIKTMRSGVLWMFSINGKNPKDLAKKMTKELLSNPHYQKYIVVK